jgi:hypothetical protein
MSFTKEQQAAINKQVADTLATLSAASEKKAFDAEVAKQVKAALAKMNLPQPRPMIWDATKTVTQAEGEFTNVFTSRDIQEVVQVMKDYRLEPDTVLVRKRGGDVEGNKTSLYKNNKTGTLTFMQYSKKMSYVALHVYELEAGE